MKKYYLLTLFLFPIHIASMEIQMLLKQKEKLKKEEERQERILNDCLCEYIKEEERQEHILNDCLLLEEQQDNNDHNQK